jgi:uncharacterized membrane protein YcaP (DUF421 family)
MEDLIGIAVRVSVMYVYALLILRLAGKRSIANLSALDLIVGLVIGDMFDDVIWAEIPLAQGMLGMTTFVLLHSLVTFASYKSQRFDELVNSAPTRVIAGGRLLREGLAKERTPAGEVEMGLRLLQEDKLDEVKTGQWEPSGELSVEKHERAKPVQKRDLAALRKVA